MKFHKAKYTDIFQIILEKKKFILMAEVKLKSPSEGILGKSGKVGEYARDYLRGGADMVSMVVEKERFGGKDRLIRRIKNASGLPVFAKDFIKSKFRIKKLKEAGADAVLLIANLNSGRQLTKLFEYAVSLGISAVVEVDNEKDLRNAILLGFPTIAVNARNLKNFSVNRKRAKKLLGIIPPTCITLAFSGVRNGEDVKEYVRAGANGVLVGTMLMRSENKVRDLKALRQAGTL